MIPAKTSAADLRAISRIAMAMPSIKNVDAIVLDMDGLMLDTEPIYKRALQGAAAEFGYVIEDDFYTTLIGRDNSDCEAVVLERFGHDFPVAEFRTRWSQLWKTHIEVFGIPTKPGLIEILSFLERHQLPVAVATSSDQEYASLSLRSAGLKERFNHVITSDQVLHGKPAPDIYLEAARRLGVTASRCVAVEDSDAGVVAASAAGMITLLIPDLKPPSPEASNAAFSVLDSLYDAKDLISAFLESGSEASVG